MPRLKSHSGSWGPAGNVTLVFDEGHCWLVGPHILISAAREARSPNWLRALERGYWNIGNLDESDCCIPQTSGSVTDTSLNAPSQSLGTLEVKIVWEESCENNPAWGRWEHRDTLLIGLFHRHSTSSLEQNQGDWALGNFGGPHAGA